MKTTILTLGLSFLTAFACFADEDVNMDAGKTGCASVLAGCGPMRPGKFCPQCNGNNPALWSSMQCYGSTGFCWCVDPKTGVRHGPESRNPSTLKCGLLEDEQPVLTGCAAAAASCGPMEPGKFCPQCNSDNPALWSSMQCYGSTGYCWCADPSTGTATSQEVFGGQGLSCNN